MTTAKPKVDFGIKEWAFLLLFFTLPLYRGFFGFFLAAIFLLSTLEFLQGKKLPAFRIHWLLPTLFLYYLVSGLSTGETFSDIEKRIPLLFVPILFALNPHFKSPGLRTKVYLAFIIGNLVAVAVCLIRAIVRSITYMDGRWFFDAKVIKGSEHDFMTSSVMGGNYFFGSEFSYFMVQGTYFGIYLVLGQLLLFEISKSYVSRNHRIWLAVCYLVFLAVLFLLSSRAALLSSFFVTIYVLFRMETTRTLKAALLTTFLGIGIFFFVTNPRGSDLINNLFSSIQRIDPQAKYGHSLRILSWDAALEVIKDNWLTGVGEGRKQIALMQVYVEKGYIYPAENLFNTHNQYLDFVIGGGIFCLLLFILGIADLLTQAIKNHLSHFLIFLLLIAFNLLFENLLSRHAGIVFFSLFTCLFASHSTSIFSRIRPSEIIFQKQ